MNAHKCKSQSNFKASNFQPKKSLFFRRDTQNMEKEDEGMQLGCSSGSESGGFE